MHTKQTYVGVDTTILKILKMVTSSYCLKVKPLKPRMEELPSLAGDVIWNYNGDRVPAKMMFLQHQIAK